MLHSYDKFRHSEVLIRRIDYDNYPELDNGPGISPYFRVELFDFYHRGLMVILGVEAGVIEADRKIYAGNLHWAITSYNAEFDHDRFRKINILKLGLIPFRNIRHVDFEGDDYYSCPSVLRFR
ncbi:MAG: hypothetical protein WKF37_07630 [Bryobacteraceae bacterium]